MKEQIETAVPRRKFVAGDSDAARKSATGNSRGTLAASVTREPALTYSDDEPKKLHD